MYRSEPWERWQSQPAGWTLRQGSSLLRSQEQSRQQGLTQLWEPQVPGLPDQVQGEGRYRGLAVLSTESIPSHTSFLLFIVE